MSSLAAAASCVCMLCVTFVTDPGGAIPDGRGVKGDEAGARTPKAQRVRVAAAGLNVPSRTAEEGEETGLGTGVLLVLLLLLRRLRRLLSVPFPFARLACTG